MAVRTAGPRATPTTVHAVLDTASLTLDFELTVGMVKSHLQKYKLDCQCYAPGPLIDPIYKHHSAPSDSHSDPGDTPGTMPTALVAALVPSASAPVPFSAAATPAPPQPSPLPAEGKKPEAILVSMLDAPLAMGVLVRTFTGYTLSYAYEAETNTLVLTASPPLRQPKLDAHAFGLTTLSLLREAQLSEADMNELALAFTRRCVLPHTPASTVADEWPAQLVSTGEGDKTVCVQIEKSSAPARAGSTLIC
ncbi:hypothetical protein T492DRAFT_960407 [Pavlovales sp. CCMP2436]|nr:hypothetical protein T492DRAFT_960407 [Pavlovales sp. CCMP2436]